MPQKLNLNAFDLVLLDFDGLLVNTEELHYRAYQIMCHDRGFTLPWNFEEYCLMAHYNTEKLRQGIFDAVPKLAEQEPDWEVLYQEKKAAMVRLLKEQSIQLMPGAKEFLRFLHIQKIRHCVVTHSPGEQIALIKEQLPQLGTIPYWFTRETYNKPKPHPESYLHAIDTLLPEGKQCIGFEDTPKGIEALLRTPAVPVLVSQVNYPEVEEYLKRGLLHYDTLASMI